MDGVEANRFKVFDHDDGITDVSLESDTNDVEDVEEVDLERMDRPQTAIYVGQGGTVNLTVRMDGGKTGMRRGTMG